MKTAILASFVAGAVAFAPTSLKSRTTGLNMAFENEIGAQSPLGFWDPLGLVADGDQEKFDRYRFIELKHGRVCMLAYLGYVVQEAGVRLPGNIDTSGLKFADIPNGFAALSTISAAGIAQIVAFIGFLELGVMKDITGGETPGDFRNDAIDFGWDSFSEAEKVSQQAKELNNGRAAMMGVLALFVHEKLGVPILPF